MFFLGRGDPREGAPTSDTHVLYLTILGDHPHEDLDALALLALRKR